LFRPSSSAVNRQDPEPPKGVFPNLLRCGFLFFYFTLLPILATVVLNWIVFFLTRTTFYSEPWMMPALLLASTGAGGVLIRQKMEDEMAGMGIFTLAILALMLFGWLTYQDIETVGGIYSRFMPKVLSDALQGYAYTLPAVGIAGMLLYKHFTVKHYD
jgi:hypothetical protein